MRGGVASRLRGRGGGVCCRLGSGCRCRSVRREFGVLRKECRAVIRVLRRHHRRALTQSRGVLARVDQLLLPVGRHGQRLSASGRALRRPLKKCYVSCNLVSPGAPAPLSCLLALGLVRQRTTVATTSAASDTTVSAVGSTPVRTAAAGGAGGNHSQRNLSGKVCCVDSGTVREGCYREASTGSRPASRLEPTLLKVVMASW